ncbi:MAG: hypothetical protein VX228_06450, partial [Pseudomonadota bacterium]|nr:hypothetical protein [Pseudomonadota bacterium]
MATGTNIRTYYNGSWHDGDMSIIRAADHGAWLGSNVFDGARLVNGLTPDLDKHCARTNRSAEALMLTPTVSTEDMVEIVKEGLIERTIQERKNDIKKGIFKEINSQI